FPCNPFFGGVPVVLREARVVPVWQGCPLARVVPAPNRGSNRLAGNGLRSGCREVGGPRGTTLARRELAGMGGPPPGAGPKRDVRRPRRGHRPSRCSPAQHNRDTTENFPPACSRTPRSAGSTLG